jgi:Asp-tRNA(Asn)/Glu-tRNA(Gln) amidotransferase C subunit
LIAFFYGENMAAKRFTDTDKYRKPFIRSLPGAYKLLWDYLYHDCNHAGIWIVDFEIAQIYLGQDMLVNKQKAIELFNQNERRVIILNGGSKWFLPSFITFQYGQLNENNRAHNSVISILKKYNLLTNKGLVRGLQGYKDKDKDMVKDKDKDKDKEQYKIFGQLNNVKLTEDSYNKLIKDFDERTILDYIERLSLYIPNSKKPYKDHNAVIRAWIRRDKENESGSVQNVPHSDNENFCKIVL